MPGCRNCDALIMWTVSRRGKRIPIEYDQSLEVLYESGLTVRFDPNRMTCHWDSCTNDHAHEKYKRKWKKRVKRLCDYSVDPR